MDKISSIKYVDASYNYAVSLGETRLVPREAYGYVEEKEKNIIVTFIKESGSDCKEAITEGKPIIKGIVIPDVALFSRSSIYKTDLLNNIKVDSLLAVTWRDIRYVANVSAYECAIMETKGILSKIETNHIVLKNPETIRTYPLPVKNHPEDGHPTYLLIPTSFITHVSLIK